MSSYSELIKNFERIRAYMREFYVYGFKSRDEYQNKSSRSYDDERRRIESWLGDHMSFVRTAEGKNVFISIDSRTISHNPLYRAWKAKSFTDRDITLHFILFDILFDPSVRLSVSEILSVIYEKYLAGFDCPMMLDESTVRKKLKEYCDAGIIVCSKEGRGVYYHRAENIETSHLIDLLDYFSEVSPLGVIGSFILDRENKSNNAFTFKHHYMTSAMDSGVLALLFCAMRERRAVSITNCSRKTGHTECYRIVPLRIFISVQNGRQHLLAYLPSNNTFHAYRVDYLSDIVLEEPTERFDELRAELDRMQGNMWGVSIKGYKRRNKQLEHVEFTVRVNEYEQYIVNRLEREKRVGSITRIDDNTYRFSADVYDSSEMIPWIRTFICRIQEMSFSNRAFENQFKQDLYKMYRMYGVERMGKDDIQ